MEADAGVGAGHQRHAAVLVRDVGGGPSGGHDGSLLSWWHAPALHANCSTQCRWLHRTMPPMLLACPDCPTTTRPAPTCRDAVRAEIAETPSSCSPSAASTRPRSTTSPQPPACRAASSAAQGGRGPRHAERRRRPIAAELAPAGRPPWTSPAPRPGRAGDHLPRAVPGGVGRFRLIHHARPAYHPAGQAGPVATIAGPGVGRAPGRRPGAPPPRLLAAWRWLPWTSPAAAGWPRTDASLATLLDGSFALLAHDLRSKREPGSCS